MRNLSVIIVCALILSVWISGCGGESALSVEEQETLQVLIANKLSQTAVAASDTGFTGIGTETPANTAIPLQPTETQTLTPSWTPEPSATSSPLPSPTQTGGGGVIAFTSSRDGTSQIYVMNTDGSEQTRVTGHSLESQDPGWSPDGSTLIYIAMTGEKQSNMRSIEMSDKQETVILGFDGVSASPNLTIDDQIVLAVDLCVFSCGTDDPTYYSRIMLRDLDGGEVRQISPGSARFFRPKVSPDGARVLVETDNSVVVYRLSTFTRDPNMVPISYGNSQDGAWSPDGNQIAFVSYQNNQYDIFIVNVNTGEITPLTNTPDADRYPSWSPDGRWISFASKVNGNWDIYVMDLENSQVRRLTDDPAVDTKPAWSPGL